jgi:hypothetical protein
VSLRDSPLWQPGGLDHAQVLARAQRHFARRADFAKPLWALLVLDRWLRRTGVGFAR